jgi:hypothetical protein
MRQSLLAHDAHAETSIGYGGDNSVIVTVATGQNSGICRCDSKIDAAIRNISAGAMVEMTEESVHPVEALQPIPDPNKENEVKRAFDVDDFNIGVPWSPQIYFSVRGAENFHIYLWIAKDLGE